jgi:hypothetical protein
LWRYLSYVKTIPRHYKKLEISVLLVHFTSHIHSTSIHTILSHRLSWRRSSSSSRQPSQSSKICTKRACSQRSATGSPVVNTQLISSGRDRSDHASEDPPRDLAHTPRRAEGGFLQICRVRDQPREAPACQVEAARYVPLGKRGQPYLPAGYEKNPPPPSASLFSIPRRTMYILKRATVKFPGDLATWLAYVEYAGREGMRKIVTKGLTR